MPSIGSLSSTIRSVIYVMSTFHLRKMKMICEVATKVEAQEPCDGLELFGWRQVRAQRRDTELEGVPFESSATDLWKKILIGISVTGSCPGSLLSHELGLVVRFFTFEDMLVSYYIGAFVFFVDLTIRFVIVGLYCVGPV